MTATLQLPESNGSPIGLGSNRSSPFTVKPLPLITLTSGKHWWVCQRIQFSANRGQFYSRQADRGESPRPCTLQVNECLRFTHCLALQHAREVNLSGARSLSLVLVASSRLVKYWLELHTELWGWIGRTHSSKNVCNKADLRTIIRVLRIFFLDYQ